MQPDDPRHGEERGYFAHRKAGQVPCDACQQGHTKATKRRELARMRGASASVPSLGTARRIQALIAIGWSADFLAAELGWAHQSTLNATIYRKWLHRETAERVDALYRRLCMTPGDHPQSLIRARKNGWLPPLAWDDIDNDTEPDLTALRPLARKSAERAARTRKPDCGTERGYQWHRTQYRRGKAPWPLPADDPCGCRAAHSAHEAGRYLARKESAA